MHRVLLNIAGVINLTIGSFVFLLFLIFGADASDVLLWFPSIILLGTSGVFLYAGNKGDLDKRFYKFVLISGIFSVFSCSIISAILGILGYTMLPKSEGVKENEVITREKKVLTAEEKEARRLRNILSLGVGLVVLAGVIFATSTWETLTGFSKTIILIFAGILFYLVSALAEKKLKLKVSGMMYYGLSNVLIVVSILSSGYFNVFGDWFSLNGAGSNLFITVIWAVVGFFSYVAYIKYDIKSILYVLYLSLLGIIYFGILAICNIYDIAFLAVTLIVAVGSIFKNNNMFINIVNRFSKVILIILTACLFINITNGQSNMIFTLISFVVLAITGYYLALVEKNEFFSIFAPLSTLINSVAICAIGDATSRVMLIQISIIVTAIYAVGYYKRENKFFYNVSSVLCNFAWLYVVIDSIDIRFYSLAVATSLVMLAISIVVGLDKNSEKLHFEKLVEPVKILVFAYSLNSLLNSFENIIKVDFAVVMAVIFLGMYLIRKDLFRFIYFVICCFTTLIIFFSNFGEFAIISNIALILVGTVLLISVCKSSDNKYLTCKEAIYGVLLLSIYSLFNGCIGEYNEFSWLFILGMTVSYIIMFFFVSKNNIMKLMTVLAVFIPYSLSIDNFMDLVINDNNFKFIRNMRYIFESIPWLIMIIIYTRGFLKSVNLKVVKIIEIITLSTWYIAILRRVTPEVGLFVGIIALISILVGYKSEKYVSFYYTGIVFTVINLLIQLKDLWSVIPIWAYILVAGLILIGIVTYKEYIRINPKVEEVVPDVVDAESNEVKKLPVDTRTVLIGSIIYFLIFIISVV